MSDCCSSCDQGDETCNYRKVEVAKLPPCCYTCKSVRKGKHGMLFCGLEPEDSWDGIVRAINVCDFYELGVGELAISNHGGLN